MTSLPVQPSPLPPPRNCNRGFKAWWYQYCMCSCQQTHLHLGWETVGTGFLVIPGGGSRTGMSKVKNLPCCVHCLVDSCAVGQRGLPLRLPAQISTAMERTRTQVPKMALFPPAGIRSGQTVRSSFAPPMQHFFHA